MLHHATLIAINETADMRTICVGGIKTTIANTAVHLHLMLMMMERQQGTGYLLHDPLFTP